MSDVEHLITDHCSGHAFPCRGGETLLNAAARSGRQIIRVGCRAGGCGLCKVQVLAGRYDTGKMSRAQVSEADEGRGFVLACRTMPAGALEILSQNETNA